MIRNNENTQSLRSTQGSQQASMTRTKLVKARENIDKRSNHRYSEQDSSTLILNMSSNTFKSDLSQSQTSLIIARHRPEKGELQPVSEKTEEQVISTCKRQECEGEPQVLLERSMNQCSEFKLEPAPVIQQQKKLSLAELLNNKPPKVYRKRPVQR